MGTERAWCRIGLVIGLLCVYGALCGRAAADDTGFRDAVQAGGRAINAALTGSWLMTQGRIKNKIVSSLDGTRMFYKEGDSGEIRTAILRKTKQAGELYIQDADATPLAWLQIDEVQGQSSVKQISVIPADRGQDKLDPITVARIGPLLTGLNERVFSRPEFSKTLTDIVFRFPAGIRDVIQRTNYPFLQPGRVPRVARMVWRPDLESGPGARERLVSRYGEARVRAGTRPEDFAFYVQVEEATYSDSAGLVYDPTAALLGEMADGAPSLVAAYHALSRWAGANRFASVQVEGVVKGAGYVALSAQGRRDTLGGTGSRIGVDRNVVDLRGVRLSRWIGR